MAFNPDRFLGAQPEPDPTIAFGFGRRICPGRVLADSTVYLSIAQSLAVLHTTKGTDPTTGKEVETKPEFTAGIISHPKTFAFSITPRSGRAAGLIQEVE